MKAMIRSVRDVTGGQEFLEVSARIGNDSSLVQGPGGNTSIKDGGILWVKASGTLLAESLTREMFLPVRLEPLLEAAERGDPSCETCISFVPPELNANGLRPSIETTLHALLPQRVVIHVHCVETLAWACRVDAEDQLGPRLSGLEWVFVRYGRPGLPLTKAMAERLSPATSVVVLGNHGLVVAAETVDSAARLLADVQRRLQRPTSSQGIANSARLIEVSSDTDYQPAEDAFVHGLATDPFHLETASQGSLYPDHVIFLGPSTLVLHADETLTSLLAKHPRPIPPMVLVPGAGVLLPRAASSATKALARCLADVTSRLRPTDSLRYLAQTDEHDLLNWDAEKYRQSLNRARG